MDKESDAIASSLSSAAPISEGIGGAYNGNKPLHEIEEDIARTRVRLSATIEALERELAPRRAIDNTTAALREALEPSPTSLRDKPWAYAVPLALIASGLGWLFMLRRHNWRARLPLTADETAAEAVEMGETPAPQPVYANVVDPAEPVSLANE